MEKNTQFVRVEGVLSTLWDNAVLLIMDVEQQKYFRLSPAASRIWELLADPIGEDQLVTHLTQEYDVSPEVCRRDVNSFLQLLHDRGLIVERQ